MLNKLNEEHAKTLQIDFGPQIAGSCDRGVKLEYKF